MALSSTGLGSGLDVQSIVAKLGSAERAPLVALKTQATQTQAKISALAQLQSKMSDLQTAMATLRNPQTWSTMQVSSSNTMAIIASSIGVANAGSINVGVQSLAKAQAMAAGTLFPMGAGWGGGTLRLQMGQWTIVPPTFASGPGIPLDIKITSGDSTQDVATKINAAQTQVRASVLTDPNGGQRLFLQGAAGEANGFKFSVLDAEGPADASNYLGKMESGAVMGQYASDARVTINGIAMSSTSNTFSNMMGFDFTVQSVTTEPVRLEASKNNTVAKDALKQFMDKYNAVNDYLADLTKYDAASKQAGLLQGDSTAVSLQSRLRLMVSKVFSSNHATGMGLTIERGGKIKVDDTKFENALSSGAANVQALFTTKTGTGVADVLRQVVTSALGEGGLLKTKDWTYTQLLSRNKAQQERVETRAVRMETLYTQQFQTLDKRMTALQAASAYWATQNNK